MVPQSIRDSSKKQFQTFVEFEDDQEMPGEQLLHPNYRKNHTPELLESSSSEYLKPACYWFKFWIKIQSKLQILDLNLRGIHQSVAICFFISATLPDAGSLHPSPNKILIQSHQPKQKSIINQWLQNDLGSKSFWWGCPCQWATHPRISLNYSSLNISSVV